MSLAIPKSSLYRCAFGALLFLSVLTFLPACHAEGLCEPLPSVANSPYPEEQRTIQIYKMANQAVVHITGFSMPPSEEYTKAQPEEGSGSGSIVDASGYILTNYHVVESTNTLNVTLFDGTSLPAHIVGTDADNDLAVIKIDPPGGMKLSVIPLGDSQRLEVGCRVLAIGNPFGLDRTLTGGMVSSMGRTLKADSGRIIKGIIQTDAAINPGNSGGPLLDLSGQMVGINTAIMTRTGQNSGIGFAIPINTVKKVLPELIAGQSIVRPEIGIYMAAETNEGLRILKLAPGGPAARSGLFGLRGNVNLRSASGTFANSGADIITSLDGSPIRTADDLLSSLENKKAGQVVMVGVLRSGRPLQIPVTLEAAPQA